MGYGLGHPAVIDLLNRVRSRSTSPSSAWPRRPRRSSTTTSSQRSYAANAAGMAQLTDGFSASASDWIPSAYGNFVTFKGGDGSASIRAARPGRDRPADRRLAAMPEWLRVSIGLEGGTPASSKSCPTVW